MTQVASQPKRDPVSIILHEITARYGVTMEELRGRSRLSRCTMPRLIAYVRLRDETALSYPAIGRMMDRDHSTIIYGERVARARMKEGDEKWLA